MKTTVILLICLPTCCAFANGEDDAKINDLIKQLGEVKHAHEYSELYRSLFKTVSANGLANLKIHRDDSIALQAAWEAVTLTVPENTVPENYGEERFYRPDSKSFVSFLGFLEGRARVLPADWWQQVVLDARANRRNNIYPGKPKVAPYRRAFKWVNCPKESMVEKEGHSFVYRTENQKITIPDELFQGGDRDDEPRFNISGCFTDRVCFLALHDDIGYPHKLACVDRASNKIIWTSTVCGCWWGLASGIHESCVSVIATNDGRVFVFGSGSTGFYAHGFRASDGKSLIFFSSNF